MLCSSRGLAAVLEHRVPQVHARALQASQCHQVNSSANDLYGGELSLGEFVLDHTKWRPLPHLDLDVAARLTYYQGSSRLCFHLGMAGIV